MTLIKAWKLIYTIENSNSTQKKDLKDRDNFSKSLTTFKIKKKKNL